MVGRFAYRQRNAVDRYRPLVHGEIATSRHSCVGFIFEGEVGGAIGIVHRRAVRRMVHMSLHDVTVQPAVHQHRAFHVHAVAYLEQSQVRALQRLLHCRDGIGVVDETNHRQAYAVVGYALVYFQLVDKRTGEREIYVLAVLPDVNYLCHFFYYAAEHIFLKFKV